MPTLVKSRPKYTFKLLIGQHVGPDESQETIKTTHPLTGEVTERFPSRTWNAKDLENNVIETHTDLIAKLNGNGKFQLLSGKTGESVAELEAQRREIDNKLNQIRAQVAAPTTAETFGTPVDPMQGKVLGKPSNDAELNHMTTSELKDYAAANEIDITGLHRKDEILEAVKAAS